MWDLPQARLLLSPRHSQASVDQSGLPCHPPLAAESTVAESSGSVCGGVWGALELAAGSGERVPLWDSKCPVSEVQALPRKGST